MRDQKYSNCNIIRLINVLVDENDDVERMIIITGDEINIPQ